MSYTRNNHTSRGFTIVELLIVIVIIGILAALILNSFSGAQAQTRDSRRQDDLSYYKKALSLYYLDFDAYPNCSGGLYTQGTAVVSGTITSCLSTLSSKYLSEKPVDPMNTGSYQYWYAAGGRKTGNTTFTADLSDNYIIGVRLEKSTATVYSNWGRTDLNFLLGSSD